MSSPLFSNLVLIPRRCGVVCDKNDTGVDRIIDHHMNGAPGKVEKVRRALRNPPAHTAHAKRHVTTHVIYRLNVAYPYERITLIVSYAVCSHRPKNLISVLSPLIYLCRSPDFTLVKNSWNCHKFLKF